MVARLEQDAGAAAPQRTPYVLVDRFRGADALVFERNHDAAMLRTVAHPGLAHAVLGT